MDHDDFFTGYTDIAISLFYYGLEYSRKLNTNELITQVETIAKQSLMRNDTGLILTFSGIVNTVFDDFNQMYMLYIGKNILNRIRQEKGYNTGTYKKVINGLEDNKYLTQIIRHIKDEEILEDVIRRTFEELHT
jgi:hypothetical protein